MIYKNQASYKRYLNKKIFYFDRTAALELSIGTIVVVVLGMTMLILGLILIKNIFSISTKSVNILDEKITREVTALFTDDQEEVVVRLGPDHTAKIKPGTDSFGIAIGAKTPDGSPTNRARLQYKLVLDQGSDNNCVKKLGLSQTQSLFITSLNNFIQFDTFQGSNAFAIVQLAIPKATTSCSQKVLVDVKDTTKNQEVGGNFFIFEILK